MTKAFLLPGMGHALLVALGLLIYVLATRIGKERRNPSAAMAWVVGMIAFPYAAIPLFLFLGTRKFSRPVRSLARANLALNPLPEGPVWAAQALASMGLESARSQAFIEFHADGKHSLKALLLTIDSALHTLDVSTFVLGDDEVARQIADALAAAAQRGVATCLMVDAVGSWQTPNSTLQGLRRAGVEVRRFMPLRKNPYLDRINLRNHRKMVVADGTRLWSGGRNLAAEYFVPHDGQPAWIDLSYCIEGPVAMLAGEQWLLDWNAAKGKPQREEHAPHLALDVAGSVVAPRLPLWGKTGSFAAGGLAQWVPSGPDYANDTVHDLLITGAFHAQERITAVTPYFVPDDVLLQSLIMASRRGVKVQLLLPARSNHRLADWARNRALRDLAEAGAEIWLLPQMVHAKAVLIDHNFALCGSLNLDARSLFLNYEVMTAFYDAPQVSWLADWLTKHIASARSYQAQNPGLLRDMGEGVVRSVGFQL